jgi:hypothetical protein
MDGPRSVHAMAEEAPDGEAQDCQLDMIDESRAENFAMNLSRGWTASVPVS